MNKSCNIDITRSCNFDITCVESKYHTHPLIIMTMMNCLLPIVSLLSTIFGPNAPVALSVDTVANLTATCVRSRQQRQRQR